MPREEKIDFSEFNNAVNMTQIDKELTDLKAGKQVFEDVPDDKYAVRIASMMIDRAKSDPHKLLFKVSFDIIEGEYQKRRIFWNQNILNSRGIHTVCEFIRALGVFEEDDVLWNNDFGDFNDVILDAAQACDESKLKMVIDYSHNDKGFVSITVDKVL